MDNNLIEYTEQPKQELTHKRINPSHIAIAQHSQNVTLPVLPTIGYCLMFKRKTKYCKLSISKDKNELECIITDQKHHETLSKDSPSKSQLHFQQHHPFLTDLFSLEQRFKQETCKINSVCFYSRNGEYIYMVVSMNGHAIEEWAEKLEVDIEISPEKAITKGRQDPSFNLAHRTYCPKLDDNNENDNPKQVMLKDLFNETIVLDKLDMKRWEHIHIGFSKYVGNIYVENKIPERLYLRILYDVLTRTESKLDVSYLTRLSEHPLCGIFALSGNNHPLKKYGHMYNIGKHQEHDHDHANHDEKDHGKIFNILMKWDDIFKDIRLYYGEANGFYFAFVLHYTKWLSVLSLLGVIWFVVQCIEGTIAAKGSLFFSFIAVCWATLCHEDFKRKEWELRYKWGMLRINIAEIPKPLRNGTFIISEMDGEITQIFQSKYKYWGRILASFSTILMCIACVLSAVFGIWILKSKWGSSTEYSVLIGILNAIQIHIFNEMYTKVAIWLNDWEEHRKRSHEYDALVVKRILFIMINSFNSLFYLAVYASYPTNNIRLKAIRTQLITLFATAIVIQNFFEVAMPSLKSWIKRKFADNNDKLYDLDDFEVDLTADWRQQSLIRLQSHSISYDDDMSEDHSHEELKQLSDDELKDELSERYAIISRNKQILRDIEIQSDQDDSPDVLDNTAEIVVLHGYIIIFAIIFPIMPILGIVNNYFELRIDFYNLLHSRRPCPRASNGIGIWKDVMSVINTIAIFSNFGLLAFRTDEISSTYLHENSGQIKTRYIVEFFLGTVAITWLIKQGVKMVIPDKSFEVKAAITRQQICEKHLLLNKIKKLLAKQIRKKRE